MPNLQNLKRWGKEIPKPTSEEATKNGRLGGIRSGEKRQELKKFKEYLEIALQRSVKDKEGNEHTYKEVGAIKLADKYVQGDLKAQELVLKITGEMPSEKTELTGFNGSPLNPPVINILPVSTVKDEDV